MRSGYRVLLAATFFATLTNVGAEENSAATPEPQQTAQSGTKAWLDAQRGGQLASAQRQPLSGPVMEKIYERYVKSFGQAIPAQYQHTEGFTTGR